ncbi:hypothetical protein DDZ16_00425 [Marinilabilia rubra]|uniref:Helix-hairpin-helix domain-containing protein n=2 Tax=Marinilabilia rubra TaxID=2162893 RepID=A0A2U2BEG6_9BACT|nr:hypothetical protein DDZ16_00425 [Marinilabilia rubra]
MLLGFGSACVAQINDQLQDWASDVATAYAEEFDSEDLTFLIEDLLAIARNPININTAGREELERIFFLTDLQVENILYKRYVNGQFLSIYELQAVEGLPLETLKMLEPLLVFGKGDNKYRPLRVWGDAFFRSEFQVERTAGFIQNQEGGRAYMGDRFKVYSRTEMNTNHGFSGGTIAEKDPGEPMFSDRIHGLDLMTGYLHYENSGNWLSEVGVGQYTASAGQGLVLQSGMPLRKSTMVTNIRNRKASFRPSLSASEASGFRGGYASFAFGDFEVTPFFSLKKRDGRIKNDSILTSLREDGMHRSLTEIEQRHNTEETALGLKTQWSGKWLQIDAGHLSYRLNRPLVPDQKPYNQFYFSGDKASNSWVSYLLSKNNLLFFGEVAMSGYSEIAFSNGVLWGAAPGFALAMAHRYIPKSYQAPLAGPMTQSSSFSGERGWYTGFKWELPDRWVLSSYFDYYRFEWLKFRVDAPSSGFDWLGNLEKEFRNEAILRIKVRHREKPLNHAEDMNENKVVKVVYDQLKLQYRQLIGDGWQFTTQGQWHFVKSDEQNENGKMLSQDIKWKNNKLSITGRFALFSASDYLARLYAYEPHVLYMFSVPAYSGKGARYLLLVNYRLLNNLHLWLRAARWQYSDRETIGSGNQLIDADKKTQLTFQMRVKF